MVAPVSEWRPISKKKMVSILCFFVLEILLENTSYELFGFRVHQQKKLKFQQLIICQILYLTKRLERLLSIHQLLALRHVRTR